MTLPVNRVKPGESPGFQLWLVTHAWQRQIETALSPLGLTHMQFVMLAAVEWLSREPETIVTQQAISQFTGVAKMQVSQTLGRIERGGLITRSVATDDRRAHAVRLTSSGYDRLLLALPLVEGIDRAFFGVDSRAPALARLLGLIDRGWPTAAD